MAIWFCTFCFDQLYIKHVVDTVTVRYPMALEPALAPALTLTPTLTPTATLTPTLAAHRPPGPKQVRSNWGRVFYTNLWSCILLLFLTLALEPHVLHKTVWTQEQIAALALSCAPRHAPPRLTLTLTLTLTPTLTLTLTLTLTRCALGTAMSYFAFLCRAAVSATSFTVVGNVSRVHPPVHPLVH